MSELKTVVVVYRDYGYDGFSTPIAAFSSVEKAEEYISKHKSPYQTWEYDIFEVDCED